MLQYTQLKKWTVLVLLALGVGSTEVLAQQDKMYSQYMFNMMALNPAYAGSRDVLSTTGLYRNQWVNIDGAPKTMTFTLDAPVNKERVGLGLQIYNDQIGLQNETGAFASYAFRIKVGDRSTLALGLQAGAISFRWDLTEARLAPGGSVDPAFASNISKILPNFGTGIYLSNDRSYLGVSVPQLIVNNLSDYNSGDNRAQQRRHAYMMAGFVVGLSNSLKLKPSLLVKYANGAPLGLDGNLNLWINDRLALGTSYRRNQFSTLQNSAEMFTSDAVVGMLEVQLTDQFRLGYAYDMMLNGLRQTNLSINSGSHEIMLRYEFGFSKSKILTPRYF
ncbi:type IX secretion system membrane protein PorP/SprF [Telluribacter sp.]|jgi:type IX secretion system PorP/SprF family membrane protein|uniref:PorP/SprF family type IX secretion system membrane protein n=1 Tax=Telluribacter sp. TaxID=1978767 RepID=UPI002E13158C|nr:type IX secretion system membrane protein PorP/SprF [Telluribacter sp.]